MRLKVYEFDAHGVELNHRYVSGAVVPDELAPDPLATRRGPGARPTCASTTPGARVPHAWLGMTGRDVSTVQLAGHGRFTLFTGPGGQAWGTAPDVVSGLVALVVVGPGQDVEDPYGDWAGMLEAEGIGDTGAVLVRPDHHVAARFAALPDDPATTLSTTLDRALSRTVRPHHGFQREGLRRRRARELRGHARPPAARDARQPRRHLHGFLRDVRPSIAEWEQGIEFLTAIGQKCDEHRQEFILFSDVMGASMLVETMEAERQAQDATASTVLGPFHVVTSPERALGDSVDSSGPASRA